jgi:hypothetical protein
MLSLDGNVEDLDSETDITSTSFHAPMQRHMSGHNTPRSLSKPARRVPLSANKENTTTKYVSDVRDSDTESELNSSTASFVTAPMRIVGPTAMLLGKRPTIDSSASKSCKRAVKSSRKSLDTCQVSVANLIKRFQAQVKEFRPAQGSSYKYSIGSTITNSKHKDIGSSTVPSNSNIMNSSTNNDPQPTNPENMIVPLSSTLDCNANNMESTMTVSGNNINSETTSNQISDDDAIATLKQDILEIADELGENDSELLNSATKIRKTSAVNTPESTTNPPNNIMTTGTTNRRYSLRLAQKHAMEAMLSPALQENNENNASLANVPLRCMDNRTTTAKKSNKLRFVVEDCEGGSITPKNSKNKTREGQTDTQERHTTRANTATMTTTEDILTSSSTHSGDGTHVSTSVVKLSGRKNLSTKKVSNASFDVQEQKIKLRDALIGLTAMKSKRNVKRNKLDELFVACEDLLAQINDSVKI